MAYDLQTLITKVQNRLDDDQFDTTIITDFINDEQREILNSKRFPFMEAAATFTMVVDQSSIGTLPTQYQTPINLALTTDGKEMLLTYVDYEVIDQQFPARASATDQTTTPTFWYVFDDVINVYPRPDQAYTAVLNYLKYPVELVNSADVPELPRSFEEILVLGAWERALEHEDSFTEAQVVRQKKEGLKSDLILRTTRRQVGQPRIMRSNRGSRRWQ